MANYVLVYRGGQGFRADPAEQAAVMAAWGEWYGQLGAALVDGGAPFATATSVSGNGTTDPTERLGGYTVISADSLDAAAGLARGNPVVAEGGSVDVYETVDMSGS